MLKSAGRGDRLHATVAEERCGKLIKGRISDSWRH